MEPDKGIWRFSDLETGILPLDRRRVTMQPSGRLRHTAWPEAFIFQSRSLISDLFPGDGSTGSFTINNPIVKAVNRFTGGFDDIEEIILVDELRRMHRIKY